MGFQELCRLWLVTAVVATLFVVTTVKGAALVDFQVAQPPPLPPDAQTCTVPILQCVLFDGEEEKRVIADNVSRAADAPLETRLASACCSLLVCSRNRSDLKRIPTTLAVQR